jgi:hypothetical protein
MILKEPAPDLIRVGNQFSERSCFKHDLERDDDETPTSRSMAVA